MLEDEIDSNIGMLNTIAFGMLFYDEFNSKGENLEKESAGREECEGREGLTYI